MKAFNLGSSLQIPFSSNSYNKQGILGLLEAQRRKSKKLRFSKSKCDFVGGIKKDGYY